MYNMFSLLKSHKLIRDETVPSEYTDKRVKWFAHLLISARARK